MIPIVCDNSVIGAILAGTFACPEERKVSSLKRISSKYGFDIDKIDSLYKCSFENKELPPEEILSVLKICANYIGSRIKDFYDAKDHGAGSEQQLLNSVVSYVNEHISDKILIKDIASHCHCSVSAVSHIFSECMDISIGKFITVKRISLSKQLLAESHYSIYEIAQKCGFCTEGYFSDIFKRNTGVTPSQYRKQYQPKSNEKI